jgi:hypothetical protein
MQEAEATLRGQFVIMRIKGRLLILGGYSTRCMLYLLHAVLGGCCTWCVLMITALRDRKG